MLLLARKTDEEIVIDTRAMKPDESGIIRIVLREANFGRAQIGIEAPRSVRVDRREVYERRQKDGPTRAA